MFTACAGMADREEARPVDTGTIFRLAPMTKLVVSVLALRLVQQGLLELDTSVREWLPAFAPSLEGGIGPRSHPDTC